jgi:uncharacterized membrane protein YdbT with pleckstrin-like domain
MKKPAQQSVTSLPPSPDEERRGRMIKYSVAMSVRVVCVILCFFVHGWWLLVLAVLAVVLPYFAVVLANTAVRSSNVVLRPGSIVRISDAGRGEGE